MLTFCLNRTPDSKRIIKVSPPSRPLRLGHQCGELCSFSAQGGLTRSLTKSWPDHVWLSDLTGLSRPKLDLELGASRYRGNGGRGGDGMGWYGMWDGHGWARFCTCDLDETSSGSSKWFQHIPTQVKRPRGLSIQAWHCKMQLNYVTCMFGLWMLHKYWISHAQTRLCITLKCGEFTLSWSLRDPSWWCRSFVPRFPYS